MWTPAPLGLSVAETENQRTTKCPWVSHLEVTHCVEAIKKIRECELHCLEAMVEVPFTSRPWATPTSKPFDLPLLFERLALSVVKVTNLERTQVKSMP